MLVFDAGNDEHAAIANRLLSAPVAWLSTVRRDASPHSVPVWFAWTDRTIVVFSGAETAKVGHLRHRPRCAFTLETDDGGNDVVLVDAEAQLADDRHPEVAAATSRFMTKYAALMSEGFDAWRRTFTQPIVLTPKRIVAWSKPGGALRYVVVRPSSEGTAEVS